MSKVKRYDLVGDMDGNCNLNEARMELSDDGVYVKHRDYEALEAKCAALAAENEGLKAAFDKLQAYLSWRAIPPTWEDPLPCGEYLDVHDDAGHKNSDGTDCWPVYAKPEIDTTATGALLAEIEYKAIRKFINSIEHIMRDKLSPYDTEEMLEDMRIFLEEQNGEEK